MATNDEYGDDDPLEKLNFIENTLCMACGGSGTTKMLPVTIPYFREIVVCSFECDDCGYTNNDAMFGGELQEKGVCFHLHVQDSTDLNRQIVKSDYATVLFEELEFEIPAKAHRGEITTVEGLLSTCASRLEYDQPARLNLDVDVGMKIANVISRLRGMASGDEQVTVTIDDPSGNSFVENPSAPEEDECLKQSFYVRTPEQDIFVGLQPRSKDEIDGGGGVGQKNVALEGAEELLERRHCDDNWDGTNANALREEAFVFPENCLGCQVEGRTQMCQVDIPHFKDVIIMSFDCLNCGYRSNEVKGGGGIPMKGTRWELTVRGIDDLAREVLKSETCIVEVPDIQLVLQMGTLGSIYTTVEGLLDKARMNLGEGNPFVTGDSATQHHSTTSTGKKFHKFLQDLDELRECQVLPFTIVLKDPMGNSFIGTLNSEGDPEDDPNMLVEEYTRTFEEDEDLGLHDIETEGYETGTGLQPTDKPIENHARPKQHRVETDHPTAFSKGTTIDDNTKPTGCLSPPFPPL